MAGEIKLRKGVRDGWLTVVASQCEGMVPATLDEVVEQLLPKNEALIQSVVTTIHPVANALFLGKVAERFVVEQLDVPG